MEMVIVFVEATTIRYDMKLWFHIHILRDEVYGDRKMYLTTFGIRSILSFA